MPADTSLPPVTIGVPVYNGETHLREALDSALAQDYPDLEILISDNASTDGTEAIAWDYVRRDSRVRYWRNPANLGAVGNFGKVWAEARGRYFTWLACDDVLSSPSYVRRTVDFLEANPDVVLCGTDLHIRDLHGPGTLVPQRFPEIYPERCPGEVRKRFFAWPQEMVCFAVYGMFRREALAAASFEGRMYRGGPIVTHMEYPILVPVLGHGRIVALPEFLRTYRRNPDSSWHRECDGLSGLDKLILGWQTKWFLLKSALGFPVPVEAKLGLVALTLCNYFRVSLRTLRGEARRLRAAAEERRRAILALRAEIDKRRDLLRQQGWEPAEPGAPWSPDLEPEEEMYGGSRWLPAWAEPVRDAVEALLFDFFRSPSGRRRDEWRRDLADSWRLRKVCEERLEEIVRLTEEAEHCLKLIHDLHDRKGSMAPREVTGAAVK